MARTKKAERLRVAKAEALRRKIRVLNAAGEVQEWMWNNAGPNTDKANVLAGYASRWDVESEEIELALAML